MDLAAMLESMVSKGAGDLHLSFAPALEDQLTVHQPALPVPQTPKSDHGLVSVGRSELLQGPQRGGDLDHRRGVEGAVGLLAGEHRSVNGLGVKEELTPVALVTGGGKRDQAEHQDRHNPSNHGGRW